MNSIVVFDFDETFIPMDSDRYVVETLSGEKWPRFKEALVAAAAQKQWTQGMDTAMANLFKGGVSKTDVIGEKIIFLHKFYWLNQLRTRDQCTEIFVFGSSECLERIVVEKPLKECILRLIEKGVEVRILSDANTLFIETILRKNGLDAIRTIVSNPAAFDEQGRLRIKPYHTDPHPGTSRSPPNLCKGISSTTCILFPKLK